MATWSTIYDGMVDGMQRHWDTMARLQEQIVTGTKISKASDSPAGAFQIMHLTTNTVEMQGYIDNLVDVNADLGDSAESMNSMLKLLGTVDADLVLLGYLLAQHSGLLQMSRDTSCV